MCCAITYSVSVKQSSIDVFSGCIALHGHLYEALFRFIGVHSHAPLCFVRRIEESRKAFSALSSFLSRLRIRSNGMELWKAPSDSAAYRSGFFPLIRCMPSILTVGYFQHKHGVHQGAASSLLNGRHGLLQGAQACGYANAAASCRKLQSRIL